MTFKLFMPLTSCMFNFQQLTQTGKYCYGDSWVVWDVLFLYFCRFKWVVWTVLKGLQEYTMHDGWWKRGLEKLETYGFLCNSFLMQCTGRAYISFCHQLLVPSRSLYPTSNRYVYTFPSLVRNESWLLL